MNKIEYIERGFDFVKVSPLDIINWGAFVYVMDAMVSF